MRAKPSLSLAILLPVLALASAACATTPAAPVKAPDPAGPGPVASTPPPSAAAFNVEGPVREESFPLLKPFAVDPAKAKLLTPPPGLSAVPAACEAYLIQKGEGAKPKCGDAASAFAALDAALGRPNAEQRDAALVDLESCTGLPAGVARGLRAELAPVACGEGLVEPFLKAPPPGANGIVYGAMLGQAIAARLARTAQHPPQLAPPHDKARVLEFIRGPMRSWLEQQALAIETISRDAVELPYYGKGVAAIEAGIAELRLVEAVRGGPIPDEFKKDEELKNVYYASLDEMLEPRKTRGRDAALVGLKELAYVGVIRDARVTQARELLSRLYGGRRIDALDKLLLPPLPRAVPDALEERLAAKLPTLYAGLLLDERAGGRQGTLRQLVDRGVPLPQRAALRNSDLPPDARLFYARAHLELGRLYWRAVDFDQAAALAASARATAPAASAGTGAAPSEDATFLLALSLALRGGPDDAADMMRKAPRALPAPHTEALDAVGALSAHMTHSGIAAYDAALLHQLGAPEGAGPAYWTDVATRFHAAATLLKDPSQKVLAEDHAKAAEDLARAITDGAKPAGK